MKILKVKCLAPTRLDNYLMQQFPALNPGRLNKALRENKIKLNGKKQPLSTRVMAGDEIKLFILDEVLDADKRVEGPAWKNAHGPANSDRCSHGKAHDHHSDHMHHLTANGHRRCAGHTFKLPDDEQIRHAVQRLQKVRKQIGQ